jgi:hypothetical protein
MITQTVDPSSKWTDFRIYRRYEGSRKASKARGDEVRHRRSAVVAVFGGYGSRLGAFIMSYLRPVPGSVAARFTVKPLRPLMLRY